jgi:hypothetical protein
VVADHCLSSHGLSQAATHDEPEPHYPQNWINFV